MKTLQAFWHWVDNDKPANPNARRDKLSPVALAALVHAESEVAARAFGPSASYSVWMDVWAMCCSGDGTNPSSPTERPEFLRPELVRAVRDLSLAICPALEAMHAAVPEAKTKPVEVERAPFRREYLGKWADRGPCYTGRDYSLLALDEMKEWIPPTAPRDTFRGVDSGRYDERLSGVRVPQSFNLQQQQEMNRQALYDYGAYLGDAMIASVQVDCHPPKDPPPPPSPSYNYDSGELRLTPEWAKLCNWDELRGLTPARVVLEGPLWKWHQKLGHEEFARFGEFLEPLLVDAELQVDATHPRNARQFDPLGFAFG